MSCPICVTDEGTAMAAGARAGAGLLILIAGIVVAAIARFIYRLWAAENTPVRAHD